MIPVPPHSGTSLTRLMISSRAPNCDRRTRNGYLCSAKGRFAALPLTLASVGPSGPPVRAISAALRPGIGASRWLAGGRNSLLIVKPGTILRWIDARAYWSWRSYWRHRRSGGRRIPRGLQALIDKSSMRCGANRPAGGRWLHGPSPRQSTWPPETMQLEMSRSRVRLNCNHVHDNALSAVRPLERRGSADIHRRRCDARPKSPANCIANPAVSPLADRKLFLWRVTPPSNGCFWKTR
jgi:hypothetical protein